MSEGSPITFTARVPHYDEGRQRECLGLTSINAGAVDGPCILCYGRTGWLAAAAAERQLMDEVLQAADPRFSWFVQTRHERLVWASWKECDCEYWTKLCDEEHTRYAQVPQSWLERSLGE